MQSLIEVNNNQAYEAVVDVLQAGLVPMLTSSPGMGKSAIGKQIAKDMNLQFIDIRLSQCDPTDLNGFPHVDKESGKATYLPMDIFPVENDALPRDADGKEMDGWLIMLDEINSAALAVQAAAYKLVLDRMVGMNHLHSNVAIMAAGNKASDGAIVNRMSTALQSRITHLSLRCDTETWLDWAANADIDYRVKAYINYQPDHLHKFDANHNDVTFPCPRTWEMTSKIVSSKTELSMKNLPVIAGTIGQGVATEFITFCEIFKELPTFEQIMLNPKNAILSDEPSIRYATVGLLSGRVDKANVSKVMPYVERLPIEFQIILMRDLHKQHNGILNVPDVNTWFSKNAARFA